MKIREKEIATKVEAKMLELYENAKKNDAQYLGDLSYKQFKDEIEKIWEYVSEDKHEKMLPHYSGRMNLYGLLIGLYSMLSDYCMEELSYNLEDLQMYDDEDF